VWPESEKWAHYHPHFARAADPSNVLYVAAKRLKLPTNDSLGVTGAGLFHSITPLSQLSDTESSRPGAWLLPKWFHPRKQASALSYHTDLSRWQKCRRGVMLSSVSRGQEFVFDCQDYPEALNWLRSVLSAATA
jgi:hypothetical protein